MIVKASDDNIYPVRFNSWKQEASGIVLSIPIEGSVCSGEGNESIIIKERHAGGGGEATLQ